MDAQIRKIVVTPAKFDKDGDIKSEEFATLTIDMPLDSTEQRAALTEFLELLNKEWVKADIQSLQQRMKIAS